MPLERQKQSRDVVREACEPHEVFRGCKVFLAGPEQALSEFADLVQHAGESDSPAT